MADPLTIGDIDRLAQAVDERKRTLPRVPPPDPASYDGQIAAVQEEHRRLAVEAQQRATEDREAEQAREAAREQAEAEATEQLRVQAVDELENDPQIRERNQQYRRVDAQYAALDDRWAAVNDRVRLLRRRAAVSPLRTEA